MNKILPQISKLLEKNSKSQPSIIYEEYQKSKRNFNYKFLNFFISKISPNLKIAEKKF